MQMSFYPAPQVAPRQCDGFMEGEYVRRIGTNRTGLIISIASLGMALVQWDTNGGDEAAWISLRQLERTTHGELAT